MVFRKRKAFRKPRRKVSRRKTMMTKAVKSNLVSIKRTCLLSDFTINTLTWSSTPYYFTLSQLPAFTEFTALFEQYRINAVKLLFLPTTTGNDLEQLSANSVAGGVWSLNPRVYTIIDKDGAPNISTETDILQNSNMRIVSKPFEPFSVYIRSPAVQIASANSGSLVGAVPKSKQWIDTDNYNLQHWGAAIGGNMQGVTTAAIKFRVLATFYMQFKGAQ